MVAAKKAEKMVKRKPPPDGGCGDNDDGGGKPAAVSLLGVNGERESRFYRNNLRSMETAVTGRQEEQQRQQSAKDAAEANIAAMIEAQQQLNAQWQSPTAINCPAAIAMRQQWGYSSPTAVATMATGITADAIRDPPLRPSPVRRAGAK